MSNIVNSYTSWQPLEEVIVGRAYSPDYFDFIDNPQVRNQLQQILHETEEDLANLSKTIEQFGAQVRRPDLPAKDQFVWFQTNWNLSLDIGLPTISASRGILTVPEAFKVGF